MTHSQEPWDIDTMYKANITDADGRTFSVGNSFIPENIANARRIVACVNALAGIETEALESGAVGKLVEAVRRCVACDDDARAELEKMGMGSLAVEAEITESLREALKPFPAATA